MKKKLILAAVGVVVIVIGVLLWNAMASTTKVAFVNYQATTLGQIAKANRTNRFIEIKELTADDLNKASRYDMVFVNGMGLRLTDEQRQQLTKAAESGTPVLTTAATNPQNLIVSTDSVDNVFLKQYLAGGRTNYRNLLRYVRKFIDGKRFFVDEPTDPVIASSSLLYYPDGDDEHQFDSVSTFQAFLADKGKTGGKCVILTGQMGVTDSLITSLERAGMTVYPVNSIQQFIRNGHADSIPAVALINLAHGRMGDMVTEYLTAKNIPLFAPINANRLYSEWMADKMGMSGGFMSQSVVTPEIDGAIRPWTLFAHYEGDDGLPYVEAIPDRLEEFVESVSRTINLQSKPNSEKRLAIFYFKGPGQNALVAEGMEVGPSLYNLLTRLRAEGYNVDGLPASAEGLEQLLARNGKVFGKYAEGAMADFVNTAHPQIITEADYDSWTAKAFDKQMRLAVDSVDGAFPGHGLKTTDGNLALARIQLGNIVLIPQTAAGLGDDDFKIVHGTDAAPPHNYVAAYLWARYGFKADALLHFGAHGSLEFTPRKQVALGSHDWPDRLVGTTPHFYIWSTSNVGEAMMAKRRAYATIINHLTPPFLESGLRNTYRNLSDAIAAYNKSASTSDALKVKRLAVELGIHRELRIDSILSQPYTADEIARIENFAEELASEKITGAHYIMGRPYADSHIASTVTAMTVDPIAYSLYALDRQRSLTKIDYDKQRSLFNATYTTRARNLVGRLLSGRGTTLTDDEICRTAGITTAELDSARRVIADLEESKDLFTRMLVMSSSMPAVVNQPAHLADRRGGSSAMKRMMSAAGMDPSKALAMAKKMGADSAALAKMEAAMKAKKGGKGGGTGQRMAGHGARPAINPKVMKWAQAISEIEHAMRNVGTYRDALLAAPDAELTSVVNGLAGGFTAPSPGGDPILNPAILPTGRNMFAVNAELTPTATAWDKGKALADQTLSLYRRQHGDSLPRKVSYTLWSSEFIQTEGATIAQVLYMLGVEPVRDPFGRVTDLRLIPSKELGRPRIDVVVQTSGQLRDLAASRLFLISRAVKMAAESSDDVYPNFVADGVVESERHLVDNGVSPKEARRLSTSRVFGGVNGNYGSGIQGMVEAGDRWEGSDEIARTYIENMGAGYGSEEDWEAYNEHAFEAALTRTDVVVQPRQSNTWGALSLDHVYEFMGGMNLAVKNVTGRDPEAYLSDYRNRNNARMQEVKEAIGIESRSTILNPVYIKEKMQGGAGDMGSIADVVRNTYGWNVMKPTAIDNELWDDIYNVYVADSHNLDIKERFTEVNPAAIQELTAVMLETARKGMWKASDEQLRNLAELHSSVIDRYKPSCSGFVCDNAKLRDFIKQRLPEQQAASYDAAVAQIRAEQTAGADGSRVMKKEEMNPDANATTWRVNGAVVIAVVIVALIAILIILRRRRKAASQTTTEE